MCSFSQWEVLKVIMLLLLQLLMGLSLAFRNCMLLYYPQQNDVYSSILDIYQKHNGL